jgi:hypothetical protein
MSGRKLAASEHKMDGTVYVGRPVPSGPIKDPVLRRAGKRDRAAIERLKRQLDGKAGA